MSVEIPSRVAESILNECRETDRLMTLSDEQLVREYFKTRGAEDDLIVEEMCTRLWPGWLLAEDL